LVNYELGFSLVMQEIIKARKPFVGHNLFLDLLFLYNQFIDDLPEHLEIFIAQIQKLFPYVYDTKCMATSLSLFNKTDLNSMSTQIFQTKKFKNYLEFDFDLLAGFNKYMSKTMLHEAGYDSYLTGVCFGSMVKYLEAQNLMEFQKHNSNRPFSVIGQIGQVTARPTIESKRTDRLFQVPVPDVSALADIASAPVDISCAIEFLNFIQISLDGVRFMRIQEGGDKYPSDIIDELNQKVLYI